MKFSYQFSNLLGCPYRNGNVAFSSNGDSLICPAGNCITVFDLKKNLSRTLPFQTSFNITHISFSPNGHLAMAANENNDLLSISMISRSLLRTYHMNGPIHDIQWSPNGRLVAVAKGTTLIIYCAPNCVKDVNPFHVVRMLHGPYDDIVSLCWSSDSTAIVAGSRDGTSRVYSCDTADELKTETDEYESYKVANINWSRKNVKTCSLGGASGAVVAVFFESSRNPNLKVDINPDDEDQSYLNVYVVTANGQVFVWNKNSEDKEIEARDGSIIKALVYNRKARYSYKGAIQNKKKAEEMNENDEEAEPQVSRKPVRDDSGLLVDRTAFLKTACYHQASRILCAGFSDGSLFIHEMPSFTPIHSLSVSNHPLSSVRFNASGEWLAIASKQLGQIAVWEWRSETFVLKQQGHFHATSAVAISPDGRHLASGGNDAKIKLWDLASGHSYVTFSEHSAGIVGLAWTQSGKAIISASLDGTVRAFDTTRYRNFRTFATPKTTQLTCLSVDDSGELVAAGAGDAFEVFLWSISTGQLLETFAGHQAPISSITFLPTPRAGMLVSGSWDGTVRMWAVTGADGADSGGGTRDALKLSTDVLAVTSRPDGMFVAAATLDCQIAIIDTETSQQVSCIEAKYDVGTGRQRSDMITAKQRAVAGGQYFSALRYSPDGEYLVAAGLSRFLCIYSVKTPGEEILLRRLQISLNLSLDANQSLLSRRNQTEFGPLNPADLEGGDSDGDDKIRLPGVTKYDMSSRKHSHAIRVWSLDFNPGGDNFVAASSEGLLVYSLNADMTFDPIDLDVDMTVDNAENLITEGDISRAVVVGLKLKNRELIARAAEQVKPQEMGIIVSRMPSNLIPDFIAFIASRIDGSDTASVHLELYLKWADALLLANASKFFASSSNKTLDKIAPALTLLQRAVSNRLRVLGQLCDFVHYTSKILIQMSKNEAPAAQLTTDQDMRELGGDTD